MGSRVLCVSDTNVGFVDCSFAQRVRSLRPLPLEASPKTFVEMAD